ncbi:MAG: hypothetical protein JSS66_03785 [Armatimonadetes bacterium]|nr:hypothetical protein [Armatimonadota bacterium]
MTTLLLTLALLRGQDFATDPRLDAKVTMRLDAAPLTRLLPSMAKQQQLDLKADPNTWNQVVLVSCKDRALREVMNRLAEVTDCEWKASGNGYLLTPSIELRKAREGEALAERLKQIEEVYRQFRELVAAPYTKQSVVNALKEQDRKSSSQERDPLQPIDTRVGPQYESNGLLAEGRLLARVMLAIPPEEIAKLPPRGRIVYSNQPTKRQRSLNVDLDMLEKGLAKDQEVVNAARVQLKKEEKSEDQDIDEKAEPIDWKGAKINVVISETEFYGIRAASCALQIVVPHKYSQVQATSGLYVTKSPLYSLMGQARSQREPSINLKPESREQLKFLLQLYESDTQPKQPPFLQHPDTTEPLSLYVNDLFLALAAAGQKDLVAELPDEAIICAFLDSPEPHELEPYRSRMESLMVDPVANDSGWLLYRPKMAHFARQDQVDRSALAWFVGPGQQEIPNFPNACKYSFERKSRAGTDMVEMVLLLTNDDSIAPPEPARAAVMEFIGSLDPTSRGALFGGRQLTYGRLPANQKALVDAFVFGAYGPQLLAEDSNESLDDREEASEPTEVCANGVPFEAPIEVKQQLDPLLFSKSEESGWRAMEPDELAWIVATNREPKKFPEHEPQAMPKVLRVGWRRTYAFRLWVKKGTYFGFDTSEDSREPAPREYSFDSLPPEAREPVDKRVQELLSGSWPPK